MAENNHRQGQSSNYRAPGKERASVPIIYVDENGKRTKRETPSLKIDLEETVEIPGRKTEKRQEVPSKEPTRGSSQERKVPAEPKRPAVPERTSDKTQGRKVSAEPKRTAVSERTSDKTQGRKVTEEPKRTVVSERTSDKTQGRNKAETPQIDPPDEEKPKRKKGKRFFAFLLIVLILLITEFIVLYFFSSKVNYEPFEAIQDEVSYGLPKKNAKGVLNILLIGSDTRSETERGQSDAMILVSICPLQHKIYLTSLLRDSYVDIPGYGQNRLNHAYTMGGARLLTETVEKNFRVRVDGYMKVDFSAFIDIIDAFGGVELEITQPEIQYVDGYLAEVNILLGYPNEDCFIYKPGVYTLNGRQALAYSRIRYIGTDFGRTERQRNVLKALLKKIRKTNPVTTVKAVIQALSKVSTNLETVPLTLLLMRAPFLVFYKIESSQIPADGLWWNELMENGQEVLGMDMEANRKYLYERIYGNGFLSAFMN